MSPWAIFIASAGLACEASHDCWNRPGAYRPRSSPMRLVIALILTACVVPPAPGGKIETLAGTGKAGYAGDGGKAVLAQLNQPFHCDLDGDGNVDVAGPVNQR